MRFSLTGDQSDAALLVQSIVLSADHSLDAVFLHGPLEERLQTRLPAETRRVTSPEDAFVASGIDSVIVAESRAEESIRLARHASQAEYHVVVVPPRDVSTAFSYELHLLLDDSRRGIVVLTGHWYLPDTISVDRRISDGQLTLPAVTDDADPAATLMHAVDACAALGFADSQVTVLGVTDDAAPVDSRQIVLSGSAADGKPHPAVTLNCSRSAEMFRLRGHTENQTIDDRLILPGHTDVLPTDLARLLCQRIADRISDVAACQVEMDRFSRTLQVVGAVERSVRRRRTIDVYMDELTERSVFKTQMTAIGCGVLGWLVTGMVGYLMIGQLLKPPTAVLRILRALWCAPLAIFLVAQFLMPIARRRQQTGHLVPDDRTTEDYGQNTATHSV